jgi:hypothetical protein
MTNQAIQVNRTCPACRSEYSTVTPCVRCKQAICWKCPGSKSYGAKELVCGACLEYLASIADRLMRETQ